MGQTEILLVWVSEESVLGYGISLILLNVGMYVGIPAVVIVGIRKKF